MATIKVNEEAVKKIAERVYDNGSTVINRNDLEEMFPELKVSEDERIREKVIATIHLYYGEPLEDEAKEMIAWLEKKGEQKLTLPKWKYKKDNTPLLRDSLILNKYGCVAKSPSGALVSDVWVIDYDELAKLPKEEFEKPGEQKFEQKFFINDKVVHKATGKIWTIHHYLKDTNSYYVEDNDGLLHHYRESELKLVEQKSTDKIEPKFKVGDWVMYCGNPYQITGLHNDTFTLTSCDGSYFFNNAKSTGEPVFHLWTIQDAKAGDVLAVENIIFIYKRTLASHIVSYCKLINDIFEPFDDARTCCEGNPYVLPATQEQRNQLEKAMTDAGYTFDFEKKELKKIEQKPAEWNAEDENMRKTTILYLENTKDRCAAACAPYIAKCINWLKSLRPQNWTKEDKKRYISCLQRLSTGNPEQPETINSKWFKEHVYSQSQWKPNEEQIRWLYCAMDDAEKGSRMKQVLYELLEQLKKLIEE